MNVLLITPKYPPDTGGAAQYFQVLARTFQNHGHTVRILTARPERQGASIPPAGVRRVLPITRPHRALPLRGVEAVWRQSALAGSLRWARSRHAVVHLHNSLASPLVGVLAQRWGVRVVVDLRDHRRIPDPGGYVGALAVSEELAEAARSKGFRARALPLPLTADLPARRTGAPDRIALYAGQITAAKGAQRFWQAARLLEEQGWWDEWQGEALLAGAAVEGWTPASSAHVRYLGPLPHRDLMQVVARSALVVLPSETEGIPRIVAEASALDVPVLVHGADDLGPDVSPKSLLRAYELQPETLAQRMRDVLMDPPPALNLSSRACRAEEFAHYLLAGYRELGLPV